MTDPRDIPHLVKLLDDESPEVRGTVIKELTAFGPTLKGELKKQALALNLTQKESMQKIFEGHKRIWLKHAWPNWMVKSFQGGHGTYDYRKMESALSILSEFLSREDDGGALKGPLDQLALAYRNKFKETHPSLLAKFLFKEIGIQGDEDDYYNLQNNNLIYVIKEKKGIPISLTALYMLVGMRLGIKIEGCHFPGHFLARIALKGKDVFVDCFNGGQIIEKKELLSIRDKTFKGMENILQETADVQTIIRCFLANLIRSYQVQGDAKSSDLLIELFRDMDMYLNDKKTFDFTPEDIIHYAEPLFQSGQCVNHSRYGYRGIIVDVDQSCEATDDWYYGNQTQPSRHQPWYHVLVDGSDQVTYVAENNLIKDYSTAKMNHPLLSYFFTKNKKGQYIRNDNSWPETDF